MNHEQNLSLGRSLSPEILSLSVWLLSHSLTGFVLRNETAGNQMTGNLFSHHAWLTPPPMRKFVFVRRRLFPFLCCPSTDLLSEESISSLPSWQADRLTDSAPATPPVLVLSSYSLLATASRPASCCLRYFLRGLSIPILLQWTIGLLQLAPDSDLASLYPSVVITDIAWKLERRPFKLSSFTVPRANPAIITTPFVATTFFQSGTTEMSK